MSAIIDFIFDHPWLCLSFVLFLAVIGIVAESQQWERFKTEHECKIVSKSSGDTFNTFSSSGNVGIGYIPGKTGWACNDGITYYR